MADRVPAEDIERIVGASRHPQIHIARAVSAERRVYVLHSQECLDSGVDLLDCPFSWALDVGIDIAEWRGREDTPVAVSCDENDGRLIPGEAQAVLP